MWEECDIWACRTDGSDLRRLTRERYYEAGSPMVSPDGRTLLYLASLAPLHAGEEVEAPSLYALPLSNRLKIADIPQPTRAAPVYDKYLTDSMGRLQYQLPDGYRSDSPIRMITPSLSRDGQTLVFACDALERDIWTAPLSQKNSFRPEDAHPLHCALPTIVRSPVFSPDGRFVYYLSGNTPDIILWKVDRNGTKDPQRICAFSDNSAN